MLWWRKSAGILLIYAFGFILSTSLLGFNRPSKKLSVYFIAAAELFGKDFQSDDPVEIEKWLDDSGTVSVVIEHSISESDDPFERVRFENREEFLNWWKKRWKMSEGNDSRRVAGVLRKCKKNRCLYTSPQNLSHFTHFLISADFRRSRNGRLYVKRIRILDGD